MEIKIIDNQHPLFQSVKDLGRKYAATLGFMPDGGFDDYGKKSGIIIASEKDTLQGYLLFRESSRYNRVNIIHLCIDAKYRGTDVSGLLLQNLVKKYKDTTYSSIELWCRDDYKDAVKLWSRFGFTADMDKRSKSVEEHSLIHWRYLLKPQSSLFSPANYSDEIVSVLLDTNIILKLRDGNVSSSLDNPYVLLSDSIRPLIECFVSGETYNETLRDDQDERARQTRKFLVDFHQISAPSEKITKLSDELKQYISGTRVNDESDRRQVSTCIECGIPYLLTFDEPLIKKSEIIEDNYGVKIMHPTQFVIELDAILNKEEYNPVSIKGSIYDTISKISSDQLDHLISLFWQQKMSEDKRAFKTKLHDTIQNPKGTVKTIKHDNTIIALIGQNKNQIEIELPIVRVNDTKQGKYLFMNLMSDIIMEASRNNIHKITICDDYLLPIQKEILSKIGFVQTEQTYVKYIYSRTINSVEVKQLLVEKYQLTDEVLTGVSPFEIETLFFPLKIRDANIPSYIIPIKPVWAKELFDSYEATQTIFGADTRKLWNIENVYYRNRKPDVEKSGARILWYVSDDKRATRRKGIVACSYLDDCIIGKAKELFDRFKHYGVYEWNDLMRFCDSQPNKIIKVLRFSHTEIFDNVISLSTIRRILKQNGGSENTTFQSPLEVNSKVFFEIYERRSHDN